MITISDIEHIKNELIEIFPDAVRGSVANSRWGNGKRELHLAFFIGSDTVGGYKIVPKGDLYQLIAWDTNTGIEWMYCHHDKYYFVSWVKRYFSRISLMIDRTVGENPKFHMDHDNSGKSVIIAE
jgi:hypothetical protein